VDVAPHPRHQLLLRLAGTELPLFEPAALEAIYHATSGLPRKVNGLAHHALTAAALAKRQTVIGDVARRAGVTAWMAGPPIVDALRCAAGITRCGARPSAALLARLPAVPWLRSHLRRPELPDDERQTTLL
jgi:hypothetical protein